MTDAATDCDRIFSEFTRRLARGERLSIHELCTQYPSYSCGLRERYAKWREEQRTAAMRDLPQDSVGVACCGRDDPAWREFVAALRARGSAFERFRIDGEIAVGPNATLYRVFDPDTRRHLALKLAKCCEGASLGRFLEEAQITAQLQHPSIVPVHEIGVDPTGRPYFTMLLLDGDDLRTVFERVKKHEQGWTPFRALLVLVKVCEAMAYAHARGVIHRDLRPANVIVGNEGDVFVVEWGRARLLAEPETLLPPPRARPDGESVESVTFTQRHKGVGTPDSPLLSSDGLIGGSPAYMAPEQLEGDFAKIGPATDVYAVGAMLYELLTGEVPYCDHGTRLSPARILEGVILGPPTPVRDLAPRAPAALAAICEKAMARTPGERTPSMRAFADELIAAFDRDAEGASPGSPSPFLKRLKLAMSSLMGAAVCAAALHTLFGEGGAAPAMARDETRAHDESGADHAAEDAARAADAAEVEDFLARLDALDAEWSALWPATATLAPAMESWISRGRVLLEDRVRHERAAASGRDDDSLAARRAELVRRLAILGGLDLGAPSVASMEDRLRCARIDPPPTGAPESTAIPEPRGS